ncbi:hypothetical protein SAMN06295924_10819 [Rathayibacter rathayi NCPPB 2980 = VKM Ac-1601]|nr:hypothetical protein FB469_1560 [Rathayibacter rathayi]SOE05194.1 hypothetical protein SAMN06295924_10819 [Rathayibacter rathayi NCPPB 2980 = VKM Ac-1601]
MKKKSSVGAALRGPVSVGLLERRGECRAK